MNLRAAQRAIKADLQIVWITPVAAPGLAADYLVQRGADHAATIRKLHDEGSIDVVIDWDDYALANVEVFSSDGVHYFPNGYLPLSNYVAAAVDKIGETSE